MLALAIDGPNAVFDGLDAFGWKASVSTLYTGVLASLVGYGIFNTLLSRHRSADVVPFILLAPVVAIAAAAVLLDQIPNGAETAGAVVMIAGVLIALRASRTAVQSAQPNQLKPAAMNHGESSSGAQSGDFGNAATPIAPDTNR